MGNAPITGDITLDQFFCWKIHRIKSLWGGNPSSEMVLAPSAVVIADATGLALSLSFCEHPRCYHFTRYYFHKDPYSPTFALVKDVRRQFRLAFFPTHSRGEARGPLVGYRTPSKVDARILWSLWLVRQSQASGKTRGRSR